MITTTVDPLIERYVAAVAARLPGDQRSDVADELRASILDSLDDRLEHDPGAERAAVVRDLLIDLGDPAQLAQRYAARPRQLVSPANYDAWRSLVLTITGVAAPVTALVTLVARIWAEDPYPAAILGSLWTGFTVAVHVAFYVTLVFWILERRGTAPGSEPQRWSPEQLPDLPPDRVLGRTELFAGLGLLSLVLAWLPWQHFRSPVEDAAGDPVPLLDPALWSSGWLWGFVAALLLTMAVEVMKYRAGDWTAGVTIAAITLDVATAAYLVLLLTTQTVVNPALDAGGGAPETADGIVVVVTLAVVALSAAEAVRGHLRHRARLH